MRTQWTPEKQQWLEEALSRSKPLTVRQLDIIRPLARSVAHRNSLAA